jgi:hypothetical protein
MEPQMPTDDRARLTAALLQSSLGAVAERLSVALLAPHILALHGSGAPAATLVTGYDADLRLTGPTSGPRVRPFGHGGRRRRDTP